MTYWARQRQMVFTLIIVAFIIVLLGIIGWSFLHKTPTCFDGIWNGREEGVDCGGRCSRVCKNKTKDLVTWWVRPFKVTENVYSIVGYFENQNIDSGIKGLQYSLKIFDENNNLIGDPVAGSTFIEPNRRSAFFEPNIIINNQVPKIVFVDWLEERVFEKVDNLFLGNLFRVRGERLIDEETRPKLVATIENITLEDLTDIFIIAIIYNEEENAIAASQTFIDQLEKGGTADIGFTWEAPFSSEVSKIEIIPRVRPFLE